MYLSDDVVKVIGTNTGNSDLLACLVLKNGDDFSNALLKTTALDMCENCIHTFTK